MNTDLSSLYPALTHNLLLSLFCMVSVALTCYAYRNHPLFKKTQSWIDLSLFTLVCATTLGALFNGETLFSGIIAKGLLFVLLFFTTGRLILFFKPTKTKGA
ncbi:MAG: hypothetical protein JW812_00130 [Alphaproteobacteria bacterium]|nr:hypothetical protein [Alphaproteobacteria bacterium]MBN2779764.1 hypothetical protein [Alphaproteobacteria bacterium]